MALAPRAPSPGGHKILVFAWRLSRRRATFATEASPVNVPFPLAIADYNDTDGGERDRARAADLAAVIVEPMMGGGGCIPATRDFLQALRDATRATGALLIFDEVMTAAPPPGGLQQRHRRHARPDTLGKYMAGGMSFGAFGGRPT